MIVRRKLVHRRALRLRSFDQRIGLQQGIAEVEVVEQHIRLVLGLKIREHVVQADDAAVQLRLNGAADGQVPAVHLRLVYLAAGTQQIPLAVPVGLGTEILRRDVGDAAVRRELAAVRGVAADIAETAGHEHAARPLLGEFPVRRAEGLRRGQAVFALEAQIDALVAQIEQIHAPVRNDREAQTRRVVEFRDGNAFAAATQQPRFADPGDLADIS